ncbi:MAG TPA: trimethylamine methyltransferase family protein, partial [Actinomycetota bacterium]|nr:trimethylamine methyltransferase family protein [Actinomycetota bacterium]
MRPVTSDLLVMPINAARPTGTEPDPASLRRGPTVGVLPTDELERIRAAALRVLEDLGVRIVSGSVIRRLKLAGARVGADRVRLPRPLVDEALRQAPRELVLAARDPSADLHVGAGDGWLGTGGPAEVVGDLRDGGRASSLGD